MESFLSNNFDSNKISNLIYKKSTKIKKTHGLNKTNKYKLSGNIYILEINSKKHGRLKFIIDIESYNIVKPYKWCIVKWGNNYYAKTKINNKDIALHKIINNTPKGLITDHINRNSFDNRKSNLKTVTHKGNMQNRKVNKNNKTGYKYISQSQNGKSYYFTVTINGKRFYSSFKTLKDTLKARELFFKNNPQYTLIE